MARQRMKSGGHACILFCSYRLEFGWLFGILSAAGGTTSIEIFFDMMPAEIAYLVSRETSARYVIYSEPHLIAARARFEVQVREVHLLEAEWAL